MTRGLHGYPALFQTVVIVGLTGAAILVAYVLYLLYLWVGALATAIIQAVLG